MCVDDEPEKYSVMVQNGKREEGGDWESRDCCRICRKVPKTRYRARENHSDTEVNACNASCTKEEAEEEEVHQLNGQCRPGVGHLSSSSLTSAVNPVLQMQRCRGDWPEPASSPMYLQRSQSD
ncbi:hypothetical protein BaRGS_00010883 [Batillaria attramentaria]|uniref:Uncharacterized protein n=1 Tax=Batillaria attramentaria TaxID=370345 RepID=A0ABD0LE55_9CAEN